MAPLGVAARAGDQMRRVEAVAVVALPDHLGRHSAPLGEGDEALDGVEHDLLARVDRPRRAVEHAIVGVVAVDQPDVALVPDAMRAAHDIVDDVGVDRIEAMQRLRARGILRGQLLVVVALDLQDRFPPFRGRHGAGCVRFRALGHSAAPSGSRRFPVAPAVVAALVTPMRNGFCIRIQIARRTFGPTHHDAECVERRPFAQSRSAPGETPARSPSPNAGSPARAAAPRRSAGADSESGTSARGGGLCETAIPCGMPEWRASGNGTRAISAIRPKAANPSKAAPAGSRLAGCRSSLDVQSRHCARGAPI